MIENVYSYIMTPEGFGIVGSIASIAGILIAAIQTIKYNEARKLIERMRKTNNANIWTNIGLLLQAYETMDDLKSCIAESPSIPTIIHSKANSARRTIVNMYIHMLRDAILDEDNFSEKTIALWQKSGRLENPWRIAQAKRLITTNQLEQSNE